MNTSGRDLSRPRCEPFCDASAGRNQLGFTSVFEADEDPCRCTAVRQRYRTARHRLRGFYNAVSKHADGFPLKVFQTTDRVGRFAVILEIAVEKRGIFDRSSLEPGAQPLHIAPDAPINCPAHHQPDLARLRARYGSNGFDLRAVAANCMARQTNDALVTFECQADQIA